MLILSIDSAAGGCAVAVCRDDTVLALHQASMARGQDQQLIPMVQAALAEAGCTYAQLDRVVVTRGPGSFTGLRIGLAAAQGIGLAAKKPVIGINRFAIYQQQVPQGALLVVLQSKRAELFCQQRDMAGALHEPALLTLEQIASLLQASPELALAGDAEDLLKPHLPPRTKFIAAAALAAQAAPDDLAFAPRPLYLRAPDVTMPTAKRSVVSA